MGFLIEFFLILSTTLETRKRVKSLTKITKTNRKGENQILRSNGFKQGNLLFPKILFSESLYEIFSILSF